jgi:hypothetical protein
VRGSEGEVKTFLFRDPSQSFLAPVGDDVELLPQIGVEETAKETILITQQLGRL